MKKTFITFRSMSRTAQAVGLKIKLVAETMFAEELGQLAHGLAHNKARVKSANLATQITKGFYAGP